MSTYFLKTTKENRTMTKPELIAAMAKEAGMGTTKADAERIFDAFITVARKELLSTGKLQVFGLGVFSLVTRAACTRRNPQTGAPIAVPEKRAVKFKPAADLKRAIA
jgi:DNA-binding protein HU-beta